MHDKLTRFSEAGYALATSMAVTAFLAPLGAFALMQARLDLLIQHHIRAALETFHVAESGIEHALADLALDPRFERLLAGPDAVVSTPDDRVFPFRNRPPAYFPHFPLRYEVWVEQRGDGAVEIVARGLGVGEASRLVGASVVRSEAPYVPGAIYTDAAEVELEMSEEFTVTGVEPGPSDVGLPALAVESAETATAAAARLPDHAREQLRGGGTPSIAARAFPQLEKLAAVAAQRPGVRLIGPDVTGALGSGILVSSSSLRIADASGRGLLIVDGDLRVTGRLVFSGIVVVLGDVRFDRQSSVQINGALLQAGSETRLQLSGAGRIAYDQQVINEVDAELPDLLPRSALVTGWRDRS